MLKVYCCKTTHRHISVINLSAIVAVNLISTKITHNYLTVSRDDVKTLSTLLTPVEISLHDYLLFMRSREVKRIIITVTLVFSQSKYINRYVKMSSYVLLICNIQVRACERVK